MTDHGAEVIERGRLADALRQVARGLPDKDRARRVAESVIAAHVTGCPEHLTKDHATTVVRAYYTALVPNCDHGRPECPECEVSSGTAWYRLAVEVVSAYLAGEPAAVPEEEEQAGVTGYMLRCANVSCGKPYVPQTRTQRCCSAACRQAVYRARKRQRQG